ncbi:MAG: rod shape-determining protein MreC [Acidimicrobiales bacterium]
MARTRRSRRSRRPRLTIGLLILASVTIITLDYRGDAHGAISGLKRVAHDAFAPVQSAVDAVVRPIGSFFSGAVHAGSLEQQNAKLRAEIGVLQRQALAKGADTTTLRTLQQLEHLPWAAALPQVSSIPTVAAEVVALNPSEFAATVQLDVGRARGVDVGMPVVGGAGLVGQVVDVWSSGCTVRLVTDVRSAVGARYGDPPGYALVQGDGIGRALAVQYVAPETALHTGEVLTTSGLQNALFPPGIPIARITSFSSTPSSTQESVSAQPVVDLSALQYVDVLLWEPPS